MIRLLALLCGSLIAAITAELSHPPPGNDDVPSRGYAVLEPPPLAARPAGRASGTLDEWTKTILARPLFAPDRKPLGQRLTAGPGLPRLAGIVTSADAATAIFQSSDGVRPVVARQGDLMAGWQVTAVALDAVSLRKGSDQVILRPRFAGAEPGTIAAAEPKQPPTRWEAAAATGVLRARWSNPQLQP